MKVEEEKGKLGKRKKEKKKDVIFGFSKMYLTSTLLALEGGL